MSVKIADSAGFCFGVKRAVDTVYELAEEKSEVYTLGPIIHNQTVVDDLSARGVHTVDSLDEIPEGAHVVIRSHGVPKSIIDELKEKKFSYSDATCPFVSKIHNIVQEQSAAGDEILIVGSAEHPEVKGIVGWSGGTATVIENEYDAENFTPSNPQKRVCIVAQTTFNSKKFKDLVEILEKKAYNTYVVNTICHATQERQDEAGRLAEQSDGVIVIGDKGSSNSRKLYEICNHKCANTFFIQTADELDGIDLSKFASLSITAGASTPNTIIQEVFKACQR